MRGSLFALPFLSTLVLAACGDDSTGFDFTPILVADTFVVAAPIAGNEDMPNAVDITGNGAGGVYGGRFSDRPGDVLEWDFAIRIRDNQLAILPPGALNISSGAAITPAIQGQTFEGLEQVPSLSTFVRDAPVVLTEGAVYAARSRNAVSAFGSTCPQFAKIKAIDVDLATGRVELGVMTNERCGDPRLVPVE